MDTIYTTTPASKVQGTLWKGVQIKEELEDQDILYKLVSSTYHRELYPGNHKNFSLAFQLWVPIASHPFMDYLLHHFHLKKCHTDHPLETATPYCKSPLLYVSACALCLLF